MIRHLKRAALVVFGLGWLGLAAGIIFFLIKDFFGGAGLQAFSFGGISPITVLLGLAHLIGFLAGAFLCFAIGAVSCAHGLVPPPSPEAKTTGLPDNPL